MKMQRRLHLTVFLAVTALAFSALFAGSEPAFSAPGGQGQQKSEKPVKGDNGQAKAKGKGLKTTTTTSTSAPTTTSSPTTTTTTTSTTTTTTTTSTTTTTTTAPTTTTTTTTTAAPPSGDQEWVSPEGVTIVIDTAGSWSVEEIYGMLAANSIDLDLIGPSLTVKVQDVFSTQASTGASMSGGEYTDFSATLYLEGVDSLFVDLPDYSIGHEYGHIWAMYHLYISRQGDWSSYLEARDVAGDPRLDSSYTWSRGEIIADDYRLLFGSPEAIAQGAVHLNRDLPQPDEVAGLESFFLTVWRG